MDCVVNPPKPNEPSYKSFQEEKSNVLKSLAERAKLVADTFNSIPGMSCNPVQGAMYAFPQVCNFNYFFYSYTAIIFNPKIYINFFYNL